MILPRIQLSVIFLCKIIQDLIPKLSTDIIIFPPDPNLAQTCPVQDLYIREILNRGRSIEAI